MRLAFRVTPVGDMFQQNMMRYSRICSMYLALLMIYMIVGYDVVGRDYDLTLR